MLLAVAGRFWAKGGNIPALLGCLGAWWCALAFGPFFWPMVLVKSITTLSWRRKLRAQKGWLFDVYPSRDGMVLWLKTEQGCLKEGVPWNILKYEASSSTDPTR